MVRKTTRDKMWMGPRGYERWVPAPKVGSDFSPINSRERDQFLNGGANVRGSKDAHKEYNLSWSSKAREELAPVLDIASGIYDTGRGDDLVYFIDPTVYDWNVLPAMLASPYKTGLDGVPMLNDMEGYPVFPDLEATPTNAFGYPARAATYTLSPNSERVDYDWLGIEDSSPSTKSVNGQVVDTNIIANPKAQYGTDGYRAYGSNATSDVRLSQVNSGAFPAITTGALMLARTQALATLTSLDVRYQGMPTNGRLVPGTKYTVSLYTRTNNASLTGNAYVQWRDVNNVSLGTTSTTYTPSTTLTQVVLTSTVPDGAASYEIIVRVSGSITSSVVIDMTGLYMSDTADSTGVYLDGSLRSTGSLPTVSTSSYIPIPPGKTLWLGVHGVDNGAAVTVTPYNGMAAYAAETMQMLGIDTDTRVNASWSRADGYTGVEVSLALSGSAQTGSATLYGMIGQILDDGVTPFPGGFISGQGNSGCEFEGIPSLTPYLNGRLWGMSAKLTEVGSWR